MGCLLRLGCLIVLLVVGIVAWFTRGQWMHRLPGQAPVIEAPRAGSATPQPTAAVPADGEWAPVSEAGAARTRTALSRLQAPGGPVFVTLGGSDVASYILQQIARQMPASADSFAAKVEGDEVRIRASMRLSDFGGAALGALGALLGDRERVELSGRLGVIEPGRGQFRVTGVRIRDMPVPDAVIARLIKPLVREPRLSGLDERGLPISIPSYIGDIRVANGRITLYKNVP